MTALYSRQHRLPSLAGQLEPRKVLTAEELAKRDREHTRMIEMMSAAHG